MIAELVADGFTLLEGPRWRPDGLYVSDFFSESVLRFPSPDTDGRHELVCTVPGRPSGLGFTPEADLLVVSMIEHRLYRVVGDSLAVVGEFGQFMSGPANDMYVDPQGRAYIGGFGTTGGDGDHLLPTSLIRIDRDGSVSIAADDLIFPNGIVATPDQASLLVAETYRGRVTRFSRLEDGALGARDTFVDRSEGVEVERVSDGDARLPWLPDGLAVDVEGGVWVADAKGHGISRFDSNGRETDFVSSGGLSVYAGVLGGTDGRILLLCCAPAVGIFDPAASRSSVLLRARVSVPGFAA